MAIEGCAGFSDDQAYRAMDFLLDALQEIAAEAFSSVAHLLNLDLDIVFVDTTSTYWELEVAGEVADLADDTVDDDSSPQESATRTFGHSKDLRGDLPQLVIAMAVTQDGIPVQCWTFPGNTAEYWPVSTAGPRRAGATAPSCCCWSPTACVAGRSRRSHLMTSTGSVSGRRSRSARFAASRPGNTPHAGIAR